LVIYGDLQSQRDFDSLEELLEHLRAAKIPVNVTGISSPDPEAASIVLSQAIHVDGSQISILGLE
jgi:hypothetical protein